MWLGWVPEEFDETKALSVLRWRILGFEYENQLQLSRSTNSLARWGEQTVPPQFLNKEDTLMQWESPDFVEISVGCEINSYATAEI